MARHRSEAPPAPRHASDGPVDPFGDPVDVPRGGVAAPRRSAPDGAPPSPPSGFPAPTSEWPPADPLFGPIGAVEPTALDPAGRALGSDRAPGSVPAPWTGPTPRPAAPQAPEPGATAWSPAMPAPRPGEGRHAWTAEADVEPVPTPRVRRAAAPREPAVTPEAAVMPASVAPAPVAPRDVTPPARPEHRSGPVPRAPYPAGRQPASSGRNGRVGRHDPETNPLDLAAIALAGARAATGSHRFGGTGGLPSLGARSAPLAVPATGGHRVADGRGGARGLSPTRTAGVLAVAGALVSAGVAVLSSGSMLASAESPRTSAEPSAATGQYEVDGR